VRKNEKKGNGMKTKSAETGRYMKASEARASTSYQTRKGKDTLRLDWLEEHREILENLRLTAWPLRRAIDDAMEAEKK